MWANRLTSVLNTTSTVVHRLLDFIERFLPCKHDWVDMQVTKVYANDTDERPIFRKVIQRCSKCKKYRSFQI